MTFRLRDPYAYGWNASLPPEPLSAVAPETEPVEGFDPDLNTVPEVMTYATDHPDEIPRLLDEERAGKNRTTLINHLEAML